MTVSLVNTGLDPDVAGRLVAVAGLPERVDSVVPLTGGINSSVFAVRAGGRDAVIKLYPNGSQKMKTEVAVYRLLAERRSAIPFSTVLAADDSGSLLPQSFLVLTKQPGRPLRLQPLGERDVLAVSRQVGRTLRTLHEVTFDVFGELSADGIPRGHRTNLDFMLERFEEGVSAFERLGAPPRLVQRIVGEVEARSALLAGRGRAVLCHNDGHDANVLVSPAGGGWSVSGLLDFENSLAGDPLLDLAKTYYFSRRRSERVLAALVEGYEALDADWRPRFELYLLLHRLELWRLLASLGVAERLPALAAEIETHL
jgi:Ser/Thr protein kinase RdoA (MazF antagonist)